ncbi:hypothetical protein JCM10908_003969 [Rhodotorula pacifica]|uniref:uncharacterized protein n=1 Tax=Rhodotorula pacifica TaxID=1495444 RepID=UPI00317C0E38
MSCSLSLTLRIGILLTVHRTHPLNPGTTVPPTGAMATALLASLFPSSSQSSSHQILAALRGQYGTVGLYSALQRVFLLFGLIAAPTCWIIDAPFGRFGTPKWLAVPGGPAWLLMELVAPLAFLAGLSLPLTTTTTSPLPSLSHLLWGPQTPSLSETLSSLPRARLILVLAFLIHYTNRSLLSTWRNPSRARMHLAVPLSASLFNLANGLTLGMQIGGGFPAAAAAAREGGGIASWRAYEGDGLAGEGWARGVFYCGMGMWTIGFLSNIYHDEVLYSLKRDKKKQPSSTSSSSSGVKKSAASESSSRYSIPPRSKGLYRFVSHPSYTSEWLEWLGFLLCTLSLGPSPFPSFASTLHHTGKRLVPLPPVLQPLREWYLQPAAVFVLMEVAIMLPRATRGHRWYERTFGKKEWDEKGQKWVVVPGVW